jgi:transcriptional regulator with XRE-family HTH domain
MEKLNRFENDALQDKDVAFGFDAYEILKEIGALAKEARVEAGMSQQDLQRASGIDQAEISRVETGSLERGASLPMLVRLAHATGRRLIIGLSSREGDAAEASRTVAF